MIANLILATLLVAIVLGGVLALDSSFEIVQGLFRKMLRVSRRSKLLTQYLLQAYLRYRKGMAKPHFSL